MKVHEKTSEVRATIESYAITGPDGVDYFVRVYIHAWDGDDFAEWYSGDDGGLIDEPEWAHDLDVWDLRDELESARLDEQRVATWLDEQRAAYRAGTLTAEQIRKLESLPEWTW